MYVYVSLITDTYDHSKQELSSEDKFVGKRKLHSPLTWPFDPKINRGLTRSIF